MDALKLTLLGGFEARLASGASLSLSSSKAKALLAYLAQTPIKPHSRGQLMALLWSDRGEEQARTSLRQELAGLRKSLGPVGRRALVSERDAVALDVQALEVDVLEFVRLVGEGSASALQRAARLYQGDFLDGIHVRDRACDEWLLCERERLRSLAVGAMTKLLAEQAKGPSFEAAIKTAKQLLALDPLKEGAHRILMRLYAKQGERALALKQYETCRSLLEEELGVAPEADTEQLYVGIRDAESNGETLADERFVYRQESRDRSWLLTGLLAVLVVGGFYGWTGYRSHQESERAALLEGELAQAKATVLEKVRLAEEAQLVALTLEEQAKRREVEEAKKRAALEGELAALERELARQESRLLTLKGEQAVAERERQDELDRLRAEGFEVKASYGAQVAALEEERIALERARLALERERAKAELEQQADVERRQREEAARAAELERQRLSLEAERERFEQARLQAEADRKAAVARTRAEEESKRAALEAQVAKLRRQRDLLRRRLEALGAVVAVAPAPEEVTAEEPTQPDEAKQLAAIEAWKRSDVVLRRAATEDVVNGQATESDLVSLPDLEAASEPEESTRQPASLDSPPYRIAMLQTGGYSWGGPEFRFVTALESYLQSDSVLSMTHSYFRGARVGPKESELWNESEPSIDAVKSAAEELDVDGIVMGWLGGWTASSTQQDRMKLLKLYVIDVGQGEVYSVDGPPDKVASIAKAAFSEFLAGKKSKKQLASVGRPRIEQQAKGIESLPYRIALFSVDGSGYFDQSGRDFIKAVESHVQSDGALNLTYSYRSDSRPGLEHEEVWNGREPDVEAVMSLARKLDVQLVVMGSLGNPVGTSSQYTANMLKLYVIDVREKEVHSGEGHPDRVTSMLKTVFSEFVAGKHAAAIARAEGVPRVEAHESERRLESIAQPQGGRHAVIESPPYRIAIFPTGDSTIWSFSPAETGFADALASYIRSDDTLSLAYSHYADDPITVEREQLWNGRKPDVDAVVSLAKELDVQGVAMGSVSTKSRSGAELQTVSLYVIDVSQQVVHRIVGPLVRTSSLAATAFSEFREGMRVASLN